MSTMSAERGQMVVAMSERMHVENPHQPAGGAYRDTLMRRLNAEMDALHVTSLDELSRLVAVGGSQPQFGSVMRILSRLREWDTTGGRHEVDWQRMRERAPIDAEGQIMSLHTFSDGSLLVAVKTALHQEVLKIRPDIRAITAHTSQDRQCLGVIGITRDGGVLLHTSKLKIMPTGLPQYPLVKWDPKKDTYSDVITHRRAWYDANDDVILAFESAGEERYFDVLDAGTGKHKGKRDVSRFVPKSYRLVDTTQEGYCVMADGSGIAVLDAQNRREVSSFGIGSAGLTPPMFVLPDGTIMYGVRDMRDESLTLRDWSYHSMVGGSNISWRFASPVVDGLVNVDTCASPADSDVMIILESDAKHEYQHVSAVHRKTGRRLWDTDPRLGSGTGKKNFLAVSPDNTIFVGTGETIRVFEEEWI